MTIQHAEAYIESLNDETYPDESLEARYAMRWLLWRTRRGRDPRRYSQVLPAARRSRIRMNVDAELSK